MKKLIMKLCVVCLVCGVVSPAFARRSSRSRTGNVAQHAKATAAKDAKGSITSLDVLKCSIEVDGKKYNVPGSAEITVNGAKCSWGDASIKIGAKATVSYATTGKSTQMIARKVAITS
jgi:hypothetical protein